MQEFIYYAVSQIFLEKRAGLRGVGQPLDHETFWGVGSLRNLKTLPEGPSYYVGLFERLACNVSHATVTDYMPHVSQTCKQTRCVILDC